MGKHKDPNKQGELTYQNEGGSRQKLLPNRGGRGQKGKGPGDTSGRTKTVTNGEQKKAGGTNLGKKPEMLKRRVVGFILGERYNQWANPASEEGKKKKWNIQLGGRKSHVFGGIGGAHNQFSITDTLELQGKKRVRPGKKNKKTGGGELNSRGERTNVKNDGSWDGHRDVTGGGGKLKNWQ